MYPDIEHIFFSTMTDSDIFLTKEIPDEDISVKSALHIQKNHHLHESVPINCSQSAAISDLVVLESSTRLENPISDLNLSRFTRRNSSQSHSKAQKEKKKEGGGGYEAAGPSLLLLSKENCKPKVEENEEGEEEEEEEGFRTPTSLNYRIPEAEECPPAPTKPKLSLKRKASKTSLILSSKELQLLFPVQHNPLSDSHIITKKVRRDDSK